MEKHRHDYEKRYFEITAKMILENVYGESLGALLISDKPDIISKDQSFGIEVTRVIDPGQKIREDYFAKEIAGKQYKHLDVEGLKRFEQDGFEVLTNEHIHNSQGDDTVTAFISPVFCLTTEPAKDAIIKKLDKINTGKFQTVRNLYLYLIANYVFNYTESDIQEIVDCFVEENTKAVSKYNGLFIDNWEQLYRYDYATRKTEVVVLNGLHDSICNKARRLADLGD